MKRKLKNMLGVVLVCVGVALLAYPSVSNWLSEQSRQVVMESYEEHVLSANEEELAQELEQAHLYNMRLSQGNAVVTDPFDPNNSRVTDVDYDACLNIAGDGVMGTLSIPSIGAALPVYHGTAEEDLQHGVGHLQGTALPVGGESTHCVLAGHTGLPTAKLFDSLDKLEEGDVFTLSVLNQKFAYRVCGIAVVLPDEADALSVQPGRDLVTLVTCTPYGKNTHRLLVTGQRCEVPDEEEPADIVANAHKATLSFEQLVLFGALAALAVLALLAEGMRCLRKKKKRES